MDQVISLKNQNNMDCLNRDNYYINNLKMLIKTKNIKNYKLFLLVQILNKIKVMQ